MAMSMKTRTIRKLTRTALSLAVASFLFSSCSKGPATAPDLFGQSVTKDQQRQVREMMDKLPGVGIYNRTMDKILVFKRSNDGSRSFSFTTAPASGISFASSNGGQWVWTNDGGLVVLTEPQAGLGGGGGTVVAGNTTLNINLAVCFAVDEEAMGAGLFGPEMGDVAGVIGISGDFEALANGDFDEDGDDVWDYFHGFAYYFVYANQLGNQSYEVLNWMDDLDEPEEQLQDFSFAFVVSLQGEGGVYLSKEGHLTVSGGSMDFNGHYFAVEGISFFDDGGEDPVVSVVPGFGAMGCQ